ncbi:MAG: molybdopterin-guanine dinucleotide biosynthesis protein MobA [Anaerolineaceae bacterium]|nr:molybdopterin-guanine dinucleotide biosynthesis protein MobA [Anaerolineaceae bacterium]
MTQLGKRVRVEKAEPLVEFRMRVFFEDGTVKEIDLEKYLRGPIFEPVRKNRAVFQNVQIEGGTIAWPNGADIDPDVLYYDLTPAWMEKAEKI